MPDGSYPVTPPKKKDEKLQGNVVRMVFVGDQGVGKTSLIKVYMTSTFTHEYDPTQYENYETHILHQKKPIMLMVADTSCVERCEQARLLSYLNASVVIVCFSVNAPGSFANVKDRWVPEIRQHNSTVPIVMVGTKADLTLPPSGQQGSPVKRGAAVQEFRASKMAADLGVSGCLFTSAAFNDKVKDLFAEAFALVASSQPQAKKPPCPCCTCI